MSDSTDTRSPVTENWRAGSNSDVREPNSHWNRPAHVPRPLPYRPPETSRGTQDPWRLFEDRVRTGPYAINRFPLHPFSPMRIVVLEEEVVPEVNPRLRQFIQESPPRIRGQWNTQLTSDEDESRLTQEEQKKALKKLKKQIYNPYPKNKTKKLALYYRDNASLNKREKEQDDDGKTCAICLEDFVPKQEVLVTPCNHMFHNECIVPWVKSNGQCPVCRFALGKQNRENTLLLTNNNNAHLAANDRMTILTNNNNAHLAANDRMTVELISLIRAMEEAFEWVHIPE
ncbi:hypothetical protein IFM89_004731 [Coptis chinensis]|uniref:RING-type E3 ubiquitin transferase n=1 Tax=Coptis chinensis TaxID=261450 RepID=A0A835LDG2_9MAGN|nr:hypothetical protein IFM89_004731 [Coptis chinensis]